MKATKTTKTTTKSRIGFASLVLPLAFAAAVCIFFFVMGDGSHFMGGNNKNAPLPGDYFGTVFKGGFIVPLIMTLLISVVTFAVERYITISRASGKGKVEVFVHNIKGLLEKNEIEAALEACDKQRGSVANVIRAVVVKYRNLEKEDAMTKEQKLTDRKSVV